jgi:DNA-binding transcriptional LysR family regulator
VAKSVVRLEQHLRLRLFQRTTRRVTLTQEGAALYERSRRVLEELDLPAAERAEFLQYHVHAHLDVIFNGDAVTVPAGIGMPRSARR